MSSITGSSDRSPDLAATRSAEQTVLRLIVLGATPNEAEILLNALRKAGLGVRSCLVEDLNDLPLQLEAQEWDLLVYAAGHGTVPVLQTLRLLAKGRHDIPLLALCDSKGQLDDVQVLAAGGRDVVQQDDEPRLIAVIRREIDALDHRRAARRFERMYWESQRRCTSLLASSHEAIAYVLDGMHVSANNTYLALFGYRQAADIQGMPLLDLISEDDSAPFRRFIRRLPQDASEANAEFVCTTASGDPFRALVAISRATYDGEDCHQIIVRDLSERDALEEQLARLRTRDRLTGLFNHQHFLASLNEWLDGAPDPNADQASDPDPDPARRVSRDPSSAYLAIVELENFRMIRKSIGITAGDDMVRDLAHVMLQCSAPTDLCARIGDHTFAVLLPQTLESAALERLEKVRVAVQSHISVAAEQSAATTCSIGVVPMSSAEGTGPTGERLLVLADEACREAIRDGGNLVRLYRAPGSEAASGLPAPGPNLEQEIPRLIADQRLALAFQPIVSLHGPSEEYYEVLLRAFDVAGAPIPTGELFQAAEEADLAGSLDRWVIERVVELACEHERTGHRIRFFVKLSEHAVKDESVLLHLTKALRRTALDPTLLVFQLNESTATGQVKKARAVIKLLKGLRCPTALEHFGLGMNSFNALAHLDVDYLKLDASFLEHLTDDRDMQATLREIQQTAQGLNKQTIATAVQDASSLAVLWQCGIRLAQGYYIQEPAAELSFQFADESE